MTSHSNPPDGDGGVCRDVPIAGQPVSLRLHPVIWDSLDDICAREGLDIAGLCAMIGPTRTGLPLAEALEALAIRYFHGLFLYRPPPDRIPPDGEPAPDPLARFPSPTLLQALGAVGWRGR
ncbi:MAG TPA: ribbon-helix-helix domain-containing protein [Azospirillaceae bacterium]|nr:ribbon-helix-helix domain-containing protein [Azospirillaceae bacterium]